MGFLYWSDVIILLSALHGLLCDNVGVASLSTKKGLSTEIKVLKVKIDLCLEWRGTKSSLLISHEKIKNV